MSYTRSMKNVRIPANLVEQVRHLPLPHKSVTLKTEFLIRMGIDHYVSVSAQAKENKTDT